MFAFARAVLRRGRADGTPDRAPCVHSGVDVKTRERQRGRGPRGLPRLRRSRRRTPSTASCVFVDRRAAGRPRARAHHQGQAPPRRGDRGRDARAGPGPRRRRRARTSAPAAAAAGRTSHYERQLEHKAQQIARRAAAHRASDDFEHGADRARRSARTATATSSSTPGRARRRARRSASTGPAAGTRSSPVTACLLTGRRGNAVRDAFVEAWARRSGLEAYDQRDATAATCATWSCARASHRRAAAASSSRRRASCRDVDAARRRCWPSACPAVVGVLHAVNDGVAEVTQRPRRRGSSSAATGSRRSSARPAPARLGRLVPADQHRDVRPALRRSRSSRPALTGDEIVWDLYSRHRLDRACAGRLGARA